MSIGFVMVIEQPDAGMIPGTKHAVMRWVTNDKREISQKMPGAVLAPLQIRQQNQLSIAY